MDYLTIQKHLVRDEKSSLKMYRCPAGKWTIGVGHNLEEGITEAQAMAILDLDITSVVYELDRNIPWWSDRNEDIQHALINMCFNLGWPRLSGFKKMIGALERGDNHQAAAEALDSRWAVQVGARAQRIANLIRGGS